MKISIDEIEGAFVSMPAANETGEAAPSPDGRRRRKRVQYTGWNKLTIASFIVALLSLSLGLLSIPVIGIITGPAMLIGLVIGPIAALLGALGLASRGPQQKGLWLGLFAIFFGLASFGGITIYFASQMGVMGQHHVNIMDDADIDPEVLRDLPAPIGRAMRANVVIETQGKFGILSTALGSGVILNIENGTALVLTNRHVVDLDYDGPGEGGDDDPLPESTLDVQMIGQPAQSGSVVWIAPYGIDLALVRVVGVPQSEHIASAIWDIAKTPKIGEPVFAVGNPHGLSWTHTEGNISQKRIQHAGPLSIDLIQTSAAINSGNSGGGLYDAAGHLIGINTYTQDKSIAEGLGFAVSFEELLDLVPDEYHLGARKTDALEAPIEIETPVEIEVPVDDEPTDKAKIRLLTE
ncbi:MAG: trypsin-like peptidase domain-containing protein [Planctomycetaceae bacterium]|nr:trypsin-like peptidase domain-containing protein [Planctomycetaceae bacterium]